MKLKYHFALFDPLFDIRISEILRFLVQILRFLAQILRFALFCVILRILRLLVRPLDSLMFFFVFRKKANVVLNFFRLKVCHDCIVARFKR